ncbi:MAG: hypothetical protein IJY46_00595, partial [Lentisphaeria bacterium]|nr:hypothetical protein [Lentisphaeria bacterium]
SADFRLHYITPRQASSHLATAELQRRRVPQLRLEKTHINVAISPPVELIEDLNTFPTGNFTDFANGIAEKNAVRRHTLQ